MCYTVPFTGRGWQSRSLSDSQYSYNSNIIYMQKKCAPSNEEVHQIRESTAVNGGNSDTRSIQVVSFQLRVLFSLCQWLLRVLTLAHCVG